MTTTTTTSSSSALPSILLIEPFDGASHHVLIDAMTQAFETPIHAASAMRVYASPGKKWQWKTRVMALTFAQSIPEVKPGEITHLVVTSMLNLTEFLGLRPDFACARKIVYMHENQLSYPVRQQSVKEERDYFFGHSQICSLLSADVVLWNSEWNMRSLLAATQAFFAKIPLPSGERPRHEAINERIVAKSRVLYLPVCVPRDLLRPHLAKRSRGRRGPSSPLRIAFPHRFEHDKDPDAFIRVLERLRKEPGLTRDFCVRVFNGGSSYENKDEENEARLRGAVGAERVETFGRVEAREEYLRALGECDVGVSTAAHEFYGVAMIECALLGLRVLVPNRLCYPEIFASRRCLYDGGEEGLFRGLRRMLSEEEPFDEGKEEEETTLRREIYEKCVSWNDDDDGGAVAVREMFRRAFTAG